MFWHGSKTTVGVGGGGECSDPRRIDTGIDLYYGSEEQACSIEDRLLMHLQIVITSKLRRGERFTLTYTDDTTGTRTTLWLSPNMSLRFSFREPDRGINPEWINALVRAGATSEGLRDLDEPAVLQRQ